MRLSAQVLHPGRARAKALVLDQALSFWGGFDPATGTIVDRHHPQCGIRVAGRVLVMPGSRGSAGTPAGVAEALRREMGPAAILLPGPDANIATGALVAAKLYGMAVPVLALETLDRIADDMVIEIDAEGKVFIRNDS